MASPADVVLAYISVVSEVIDPVTAFLNQDWASATGWSMLFATWGYIVIGAVREWWVPGVRFRRTEAAAIKQSETLSSTVELLKLSTTANEITKHFFEKTVPKRGEVSNESE